PAANRASRRPSERPAFVPSEQSRSTSLSTVPRQTGIMDLAPLGSSTLLSHPPEEDARGRSPQYDFSEANRNRNRRLISRGTLRGRLLWGLGHDRAVGLKFGDESQVKNVHLPGAIDENCRSSSGRTQKEL